MNSFSEYRISVVIPCYNEGTQQRKVLPTIPDYASQIYMSDNTSQNNTMEVARPSPPDTSPLDY